MMEKPRFMAWTNWHWLALGTTLLGISLTNAPAIAADGIDPDADKVLKSMSTYLANTKAFSVNADIDFEVVATDGQKLQLSSFATIVLQRPNKFHIQRKGLISDSAFFFDGKTLTLYGKQRNAYAQINVPEGSIDNAIRAYELETGIPAPGADLFFADPYAILSSGVKSSTYIGTAYVNGIESHHLAFRKDQVDWQLWVQTGLRPLPLKYIITSKWQTAAPQYTIQFRDWVIDPQINDKPFTFAVPKGATKLDRISASETEEFIPIEGGQ